MRLSIVVPTLNERACLPATLAALQPLRRRGHEVILVDGGSDDGTPALAAGRVDRLLAAPTGRASQLAAGIAAARHEVLWLLHADSGLPPSADRAILRAVAAGRPWGRFDVRLSGRHPLLRVVARLMNWRSCLTGICTGDQGIFVTRAALQAVGGLPRQPLMEDVELSRRLRRRHGRPACLRPPLVTSSRRWERHGILRTILLMWALRAAYALGVPPERLARCYA